MPATELFFAKLVENINCFEHFSHVNKWIWNKKKTCTHRNRIEIFTHSIAIHSHAMKIGASIIPINENKIGNRVRDHRKLLSVTQTYFVSLIISSIWSATPFALALVMFFAEPLSHHVLIVLSLLSIDTSAHRIAFRTFCGCYGRK